MGILTRIRPFIPDSAVKRIFDWVPKLYSRSSYSQGAEDLILMSLLSLDRPGFYVDVGAHDPHRFSNTRIFYERGWRGINIDPNPRAHRRFQKYRPGDINLMLGVSSSSGELDFYEFDEPAVNTFDRETALGMKGYRLQTTRKVPVRRLDEVLSEQQAEGRLPGRITFLTIDVENHEFEVLSSNDWTRFRPDFLVVEIHASDVDELRRKRSYLYISELGYKLVAKTPMTSIFRG